MEKETGDAARGTVRTRFPRGGREGVQVAEPGHWGGAEQRGLPGLKWGHEERPGELSAPRLGSPGQ